MVAAFMDQRTVTLIDGYTSQPTFEYERCSAELGIRAAKPFKERQTMHCHEGLAVKGVYLMRTVDPMIMISLFGVGSVL